ncbi:MAG: flavodoxin family protein, partial [Deltaproteobacteria bacterium]|nr:flavodoxin family protein [Deltaproteobacteria bacterium]
MDKMDCSRASVAVSNAPQPPLVLCVYGSPRIRGNTDLLMDEFSEGVEEGGGRTERVYLRNLKISPCREIYACKDAGRCAINDDMQPLYEQIRQADGIALATPIMFYGVSAQAKAFIDRCQALWCLKHLARSPVSQSRLAERRGVLLAVGATMGERLFEAALLTFRTFLEAVDAKLWKALTYRRIDEKGDIERHPSAISDARALGRELAHELSLELGQVDRGG